VQERGKVGGQDTLPVLADKGGWAAWRQFRRRGRGVFCVSSLFLSVAVSAGASFPEEITGC
jgi:hypothetical protein